MTHLHKHKHKHKQKDFGRSMVEMLGVIAIIGVLSIGGIMGYGYAMDKYRSNETLSELNVKSILYGQRMQNLQTSITKIDLSEVNGEETKIRYPLQAIGYPTYFEIRLGDVSARVCQNMLDAQWKKPFETNVTRGEGNTCTEIQFKFYNEIEATTPNHSDSPDEETKCPPQECQGYAKPERNPITNACKCVCKMPYYGAACDQKITCKEDQTPYCSWYNSDGTCKIASCQTGTCTQQPFPATHGDCCTAGETAYCYRYDSDGSCSQAACTRAVCTQQPFPVFGSSGACCLENQTPYCPYYNMDGTCQSASCKTGICTRHRFDMVEACCTADQTAYCHQYNVNRTCRVAACK